MSTQIDPRRRFTIDDENAFHAARDALLEDYRHALDEERGADPFAAEVLLDYKWAYGDGRICDWRRRDLEELLLDHFPRKVALDRDDLLSVVPSIKDFLAFLDRRGLLSGDPLPELHAVLDEIAADFVAAMDDPANFGLAKSMAAAMRANGVALDDPDAVGRWIADFNARPLSERASITGGPDVEFEDYPEEPEDYPAVELPPEAELVEAARASRTLAQLASFTEFVGAGRKLTQRGNLTLADARAVVERLGASEEMDPTFGSRTFATRSAAELPTLALVFRWARAAGFVKVRHGRVSATRRGAALGARPLDDWRRAFEGFLHCQPVARHGRWDWGPFWSEILDELLEALPAALYVADRIALATLHDEAWRVTVGRFIVDDPLPIADALRRGMAADIDGRIVRNLVDLGAVTREDDAIALTPLGVWATNRMLRDQGEHAPVIGEHVAANATDLLVACAEMPMEDADREIARWIAARPSTAAAELAAAVRTGVLPMFAIHALGLAGPAAVHEIRNLVTDDRAGTFARLWLVEQGHDDPSSLPPEVLVTVLVEALAVETDASGPLVAVARLQSLGPDDEQIALLRQLAHVDHPRASELLEVVGRVHPSKAVAKAARTALFKRRARLH